MTYTYSKKVSSVRLLGLARLLAIWRASIYKLVFREIIIYCTLYTALSLLYRFLLNSHQKKSFEQIVIYCGTFEGVLPLTFILGFYVTFVANRWWNQYSNISWPDRIMTYVAILVEGDTERAIMVRRALMRYLIQAQCILMSNISKPVRKRFPNMESLVRNGIMTQDELQAINDERIPSISSKYWVPTQWFANLLHEAYKENLIKDTYALNTLLNELTIYKGQLGTIFSYDWINVPLGYTQVATISVYVFFITTLLSRQFIDWNSVQQQFKEHASAQYSIDMYVPIFTLLQLFFYLGWLKVAEQMLNPFGEDDDDFECNWILDRNLKVGFCAVDAMYQYHPPLEKDEFWNQIDPQLAYTVASERFRLPDGWHGSLHNLAISNENHEIMHPTSPTQREVYFSDSKHIEDKTESNHSLCNNNISMDLKHDDSPKKQRRRLPPMMSMHNLDMLKRIPRRIPLQLSNIQPESPDQHQRFLIGSAPHGFLCSPSKYTGSTIANCPSMMAKLHNGSSDDDGTRLLMKKTILRESNVTNCKMSSASSEATLNAAESSVDSTCHHKETVQNQKKEEDTANLNEYVEHWMSNENNDFGKDFLTNQVLSCSACQLTTMEESVTSCTDILCGPHNMTFLEKQPLSDSASVRSSQETLKIAHPDGTDDINRRVTFESMV